jgi:hypothetical protein
MKAKVLMAVVFTVIALACQDAGQVKLSVLSSLKSETGLTYNESLDRWNDLKRINGNSYIYQTTFTSWTGYGNTTELKIVDGTIKSRTYVEYTTNSKDGTKQIIDSYSEGSNDLGTHEKGALLLTIDDLYESCAKDYLIVDDEKNTLYFETSTEGLLTVCGFTEDECIDDCYHGIRINSFAWLQ